MERQPSSLAPPSLLFNGLVSRLNLFKHGTHLFYRGPTIVAVGHVTRCVAHDVGPEAMVDAQILHNRVQPATEGVEAVELDARRLAGRVYVCQYDVFEDDGSLR